MACHIPPLKEAKKQVFILCVDAQRRRSLGADQSVIYNHCTDCRTHPNFHKMPFTLYGRSSTRQKLDMVIQPLTLL